MLLASLQQGLDVKASRALLRLGSGGLSTEGPLGAALRRCLIVAGIFPALFAAWDIADITPGGGRAGTGGVGWRGEYLGFQRLGGKNV